MALLTTMHSTPATQPRMKYWHLWQYHSWNYSCTGLWSSFFFVITVNEATDAANDEQLAFSIRMLSPVLREDFGFQWMHAWQVRVVVALQVTSFVFSMNGSFQHPIFVGRHMMEQVRWLGVRVQQCVFKKLFRKQCTHTVLHVALTCVWWSVVQLLRLEIWTQLRAFVTISEKIQRIGYFVKVEFYVWLISSIIQLICIEVSDLMCAWLWRYSALFAIAPHPQ